jgi:hypothetical protein
MERKEFIENTVLKFEDDIFSELKEFTINQGYINFSFYSLNSISRELFAEKLLDYFEKVEINTSKNFDKLLEKYISNIDSIVSGKIAKEQKANKKNPVHYIPRARKYYNKAASLKKNVTMQSLVDYSRIMMCLYTEIINTEEKEISDINYASECLNLKDIIDAMKKEQNPLIKSSKFNLKDSYGDDFYTLIMITIIYFHIKNKE